ncbi:hypothetical protein [Ornithinimicrobium cerasi]|uniref:Uncharacterized protein n=1 Tax=Ornithinimicrobium cerasi TaxID=2248773 RepID=A0A285VS43_9MICO|nr:hypothetical protein [Ornithinimicrobium cerasi]SOC56869.1 hypothetical protein SAMN05421879_10978 [Ornithinimicrobium cerasi]
MPDDLTDTTMPGGTWTARASSHAGEADPARAAALLEAGMEGDVHAWDDGLTIWYGTRLGDQERARFLAVGGPPPLALERALWRLGTPVRPTAHLERLRSVGDRYRRAMDGDDGSLRWVEAVLGYAPGTLGRCALLAPDGLPVRLAPLDAGLEPGWLPQGWLTHPAAADLTEVCRPPADPEPAWEQLYSAMGRSTRA